MSNYEAIIFDLDGTAIPNARGAEPSERLIRTVAAYRDRIHLVAATGRPMRYAMPIISALGLTNPCIISGGTIIIDPSTQEILKLTNLPAEAVRAIFQIVRHQPYSLALRDESIDLGLETIHDTLANNVEIIYIGLVPPQDVPELVTALADVPGISASVVPDWSGNETFALNITPLDATKEHAVADVLNRLGVPASASIGIGDGNNDLHLFRSVGLKVAMGNASPELKAAADLVIGNVEDDALADLIELYAPTSVLE